MVNLATIDLDKFLDDICGNGLFRSSRIYYEDSIKQATIEPDVGDWEEEWEKLQEKLQEVELCYQKHGYSCMHPEMEDCADCMTAHQLESEVDFINNLLTKARAEGYQKGMEEKEILEIALSLAVDDAECYIAECDGKSSISYHDCVECYKKRAIKYKYNKKG